MKFENSDHGKLVLSFRHGTPCCHAGLLWKLEHYGIDSKILLWITNFLNNRKQRVVVDGSFSNYADVESSIPQGTVLGPLLFLRHINDLPSCVNSKVCLFADDCLLFREIKNNQDQIDMQRDLNALKREKYEKQK